jgi:hypothetical protein
MDRGKSIKKDSKEMMRTRKRRWWWQHWREGWPMTPLSIQDKIQKFRSTDKSRQKQNPHRYMEMTEEGNEELQMTVTPP